MLTKTIRTPVLAGVIIVISFVIYKFSAGSSNSTNAYKLNKGITTITEIRALSVDPLVKGKEFTVRGFYTNSIPSLSSVLIQLRNMEWENTGAIYLLCSFSGDLIKEIKSIPANAELVVTGTLDNTKGNTVLKDCKLLTINMPETKLSY